MQLNLSELDGTVADPGAITPRDQRSLRKAENIRMYFHLTLPKPPNCCCTSISTPDYKRVAPKTVETITTRPQTKGAIPYSGARRLAAAPLLVAAEVEEDPVGVPVAAPLPGVAVPVEPVPAF